MQDKDIKNIEKIMELTERLSRFEKMLYNVYDNVYSLDHIKMGIGGHEITLRPYCDGYVQMFSFMENNILNEINICIKQLGGYLTKETLQECELRVKITREKQLNKINKLLERDGKYQDVIFNK